MSSSKTELEGLNILSSDTVTFTTVDQRNRLCRRFIVHISDIPKYAKNNMVNACAPLRSVRTVNATKGGGSSSLGTPRICHFITVTLSLSPLLSYGKKMNFYMCI